MRKKRKMNSMMKTRTTDSNVDKAFVLSCQGVMNLMMKTATTDNTVDKALVLSYEDVIQVLASSIFTY